MKIVAISALNAVFNIDNDSISVLITEKNIIIYFRYEMYGYVNQKFVPTNYLIRFPNPILTVMGTF